MNSASIDISALPKSRAEGKASGDRYYISEKPCPKGHIAPRYVSTTRCIICAFSAHYDMPAETKIRRLKTMAAYRNKNRDLRNAKMRASYAADGSRQRANALRWNIENPDKSNARSQRRRARKIAAKGTYTSDDIDRLKLLQKCRCTACKRTLTKYHIDHIVPLSRGGSNWPKNLQLLCPKCNLSKHNLLPLAWAAKIGLLC
jgi:5-methylcytosine-specific restriction endonuclease McrA